MSALDRGCTCLGEGYCLWCQASELKCEMFDELQRRVEAAERLCVQLGTTGAGLPEDWREQIEAMRARLDND